MFRALGSRLFRQIASLCLIAMLPIVAALAYQAYDRRAHAIQRGGDAVFHATEALIADVRSILHSAEETLTFVVNSPAVQRRDWAACQELVTQVHRASERMAFVGVVDAAGTLVCPSIPSPEGATVADRLWFRNVSKSLAFSVGEYAIGRSSGRPSLHLSYPVVRDGEFAGAANMALDIEWLAERLAHNKASASPAVVYILDHNGRVIAKSQDAGPQLGARIDVLPSSQNVSDVQGAIFESNGWNDWFAWSR
jgi:C4-dicarboxylate-specific signal transduction histidine kinase